MRKRIVCWYIFIFVSRRTFLCRAVSFVKSNALPLIPHLQTNYMISLRVITRTKLSRTRTFWLMVGLAVNQSFNDRERNTLGSWKWLGGQDALRFGKGHDLLGTLPMQSTEDWKMTRTSFSEEDAIWRIVPFSNVEDLFIISTKQMESTHLEEQQPLTVSYLPFLLIRSSSFVLLFTLSLTSYAFPPTSSTLKNAYRRQIDFRKLRRDSEFSDEIDSFLLLLLFFSSSNSTYEEGTQPT